jgi:hypothetical protein
MSKDGDGAEAMTPVVGSLTRDQLIHLTEAAGSLHGEAGKCAEAECWRAALLLIGSALEAAITATACCLEPELREQEVWPSREDPTQWTLGDTIKLAKSAGWLPSRQPDADYMASLDGEVGDALKFLNRVRNMAVHPATHARESIRPDFHDMRHMQPTYEIFDGIMAAVFERLSCQINQLR